MGQNALFHESHTGIIASIQINGAYQSFKGVAVHIAVVGGIMTSRLDEFTDTHFLGQFA